MPSAQHGKHTSVAEVTNVSVHGFWIMIDEEEMFASFKHFPWFREATIAELTRVQRPSAHHLYWPDLDIDLAVESIANPDAYPIVSKSSRTNGQPRVAAVRVRVTKQRPR